MVDRPTVLTVHNPAGAADTTIPHAGRLDTLAGKTICELSNPGWEHDRIFPAVRDLLQKRFPTAKFIPYDDVTLLKPQVEDLGYISKVIRETGCQAVIVGMAA